MHETKDLSDKRNLSVHTRQTFLHGARREHLITAACYPTDQAYRVYTHVDAIRHSLRLSQYGEFITDWC